LGKGGPGWYPKKNPEKDKKEREGGRFFGHCTIWIHQSSKKRRLVERGLLQQIIGGDWPGKRKKPYVLHTWALSSEENTPPQGRGGEIGIKSNSVVETERM